MQTERISVSAAVLSAPQKSAILSPAVERTTRQIYRSIRPPKRRSAVPGARGKSDSRKDFLRELSAITLDSIALSAK